MKRQTTESRRILLLAWCAVIAASTSSPADDWPQFRGPRGDGTSNDHRVPTEWHDAKNLKWKLKLPGAGFSSPIVVKDFVLVSSYSGAEGDLKGLKRHLVCVDRRNGKVLWSQAIPSTALERRGAAFGTQHGFASHTPISDGTSVYVLFGNTGVLAFNLQGKELWRSNVGTENASMFGSAASPILYHDQLIITAGAESESLRALDKKTGKQIWKSDAGSLSRCYATPTIAKNQQGEDELLVSVPSELWGLNPKTGNLKWYAETPADLNTVPNVLAKDGVAYVIGGRRGGRAAIRLGGSDDVTNSHVIWSTSGGSYVPSPVLHKGHLYWINDRGVAFCVAAKTGKQVTRKRIGGQFYASIVLIQDKLYAASRFGGTYVLEATPELKRIALNKLSDKSDFSGSPAVSDGQLILRSNEGLYCIAAE